MTLEETFDAYLPHALMCARRNFSTVISEQEAEQCGRLGLLKAAEFAHKKPVNDFKAFVAVCVKNEIYDFIREESGKRFLPLDVVEHEVEASHDLTPFREVNRKEIRDSLRDALEKLTPAQRLVMERVSYGHRQVDIADELQITPTAVRNLQKRAAVSMRSDLNSASIGQAQFMPELGRYDRMESNEGKSSLSYPENQLPRKKAMSRERKLIYFVGFFFVAVMVLVFVMAFFVN